MILLTKLTGENEDEIGFNPDHIVVVDPQPGGESSFIQLIDETIYIIKESPRAVENAISAHHTKYTRG